MLIFIKCNFYSNKNVHNYKFHFFNSISTYSKRVNLKYFMSKIRINLQLAFKKVLPNIVYRRT